LLARDSGFVALAVKAFAFGMGCTDGFFKKPDALCRCVQVIVGFAEFEQFAPQFNDDLAGFEGFQAFVLVGVELGEPVDFVELTDNLASRQAGIATLVAPGVTQGESKGLVV